jgi:hypothetical protein
VRLPGESPAGECITSNRWANFQKAKTPADNFQKNMKHHKIKHALAAPIEANPAPKTIEVRAYELYLERGSDPGHDLEDWLRAEAETRELGEATHTQNTR